MKKFIKIQTYIGIIVALFFGLLIILDIFAISSKPTDYVNAYQISERAPHWMFKSISNLIIWDTLKLFLVFGYFIIAILALIKRKNIYVWIIILTEILALIWTLRYFILYYLSGYDHFPGFDPYVF
ncbi:MAG: hypothetical protein U0T82_15285 [Bacteroidales bacterium]